MRGNPTDYWAKHQDGQDGGAPSWHPLAHHCADVGACLEALLERTLLRQRLARTGGVEGEFAP
ncbi:MAG: hypothetical protein HY721_34680 [Planctomycetes bacterium]|nr:hypothetical protein [Planctomycetota bacterium]